MPNRPQHIFVLMLENRSFDHMLGFSGITGVDAVTGNTGEIMQCFDPAEIPEACNYIRSIEQRVAAHRGLAASA
jgi:phospholipase C